MSSAAVRKFAPSPLPLGRSVSHLVIEKKPKEEEHAEGGHDEHSRVEPEQPDLKAKIFLHGPEENVERTSLRRIIAIIALLHLGLRDEVCDFLIHIELFGRNSAFAR